MHSAILPKKLEQGNTIGFVAPASALTDQNCVRVGKAIDVLGFLGFKVVLGASAKKILPYGFSSGTPLARAQELNRMFKNSRIHAIWCVEGGDTANEVLDFLDYDIIRAHPKILIGLSDNTVILNGIFAKTGLITIHGTDPKGGREKELFGASYSQEEFVKRLELEEIEEIPHASQWKCVRAGEARGRLIGGNLTAFLKLLGTEYLPKIDGSILLLEGLGTTIGEARTKLTQLKHAGIFAKISGMVIGSFTKFDIEGQQNAAGKRVYFEQLAKEITQEYSFPILKIYEVGHRCPSTFLPIGGTVDIDAKKKVLSIAKKFLM